MKKPIKAIDENSPQLVLSEEDKTRVLKELKDLFQAAHYLHDSIKKDDITQEMTGGMNFLLEQHFLSVSRSLNYDTHLLQMNEDRYQEIRQAHETIDRLEDQLARKQTGDGVAEALRLMESTIRDWWNVDGFCHIRDFTAKSYSLEVDFSVNPDFYRKDKANPDAKTFDEYIDSIHEAGYDMINVNGDGNRLLDTSTNRSLLLGLLKGRFPSVKILSFDNMTYYKGGNNFAIRGVKTMIQYEDVLPQTELQSEQMEEANNGENNL